MFARSALRDAIDAAFERDVSIATLSPIDAGNNHAYLVTLADGTELVLKVGTRFPEAFAAEPETMDRVRRETDLPVPRVHGTGTEPLDYPFAVYEYVPDTDAEWVGELSRETAEQLCREAGRHLRDLHRIAFPEFGRIGLADGTLAVVDPAQYHEILRHSLDRQLSQLEATPFADRRDALESLGTDLIERIDFDAIQPALVHGDYRLDNLRVDPTADRVTTAVLDWELPTAADPLWDAVMAATLLADGHRLDPDARPSLRSAFWVAYGDDAAGTPRRRCYELLARIRLARHLDVEIQGASDAAATDRIAEHETAFDAMLAGR